MSLALKHIASTMASDYAFHLPSCDVDNTPSSTVMLQAANKHQTMLSLPLLAVALATHEQQDVCYHALTSARFEM
jgi:hypothetical protein